MSHRSARPTPWTPSAQRASIDASIEAKEADINRLVISCVDEGAGGSAAACVGSALARRLCSPLMLATVAPGPRTPGDLDPLPSRRRQARSTLLQQGRSILEDAADRLGPDPQLRVEFGEPAERLTSLAQRERAGLLVVGVPNRSSAAERLLGSVYLALAGTSPCPVVVVPPCVEELPRTAGPIVCGFDGSDRSLAAARVAIELARRLDVRVQVVHVTDRPPLDPDYATRLVAGHGAAMRVLLRTANLPQAALDLRVEMGRPAEGLAAFAAREGAPLIVNGSHGSRSDRSALLGSVSSKLALTAAQPLVLVSPFAAGRPPDHARKRAEQRRRRGRPALQRGGSGLPAEPVRIALEERYGTQLCWRTVQVGLHRSGESMARRGFSAAALPESYRHFQRRFGMPFCTAERPRLHGSWSAARMVKAAELQSGTAGAALLRRLRLAWFVEVRRMDDRDVLLALAAELDEVDVDRLATDFASAASLQTLHNDMALARRPDRIALALGKTALAPGEPRRRFTTPTYLFEAAGRAATVPGFQPLEAYEVTLHNLAPRLERHAAVDAGGFLASRTGKPHGTAEVAAATGRAAKETLAALYDLAAGGLVRRIPVGAEDELWCFGAPAIELHCRPEPARLELVRRKPAA